MIFDLVFDHSIMTEDTFTKHRVVCFERVGIFYGDFTAGFSSYVSDKEISSKVVQLFNFHVFKNCLLGFFDNEISFFILISDAPTVSMFPSSLISLIQFVERILIFSP